MPELPEVETIRRGLEKYLVGRRIEKVEVRLRRIFVGNEKDIIGATFREIKRFGKALVLELDNGYSLAIHVKMTGQLVYKDDSHQSEFARNLPNKFTHVIFDLIDPSASSGLRGSETAQLFYNDIRQFGWIKVLKNADVHNQTFFKELGPEPPVVKEESETLTLDHFKKIVFGKATNISKLASAGPNIKVLIMDQKRIGGVGNIYANDALFLAGIDPRRAAKSISEDEATKLYKAIIEVLKRGLKYGGSSENTYVNADGEKGSYQEHALVYGKTNKKCPNCNNKISTTKIGGRGTFFCTTCQK